MTAPIGANLPFDHTWVRSLPSSGTSFQGTSGPGGANFQDMLLDSLKQASEAQHDAQTATETALSGKDITQAEVFSAVKKADLALKLTLQIRNKVLEAYREIQQMRM